MLVFVYGTLISGFHNHRILAGKVMGGEIPPAKLIGVGVTVDGFKMADVGFPYIKNVKTNGHRVRGEVYDIGDPAKDSHASEMLASMDRLEGYREGSPHNHYTREEFAVLVDGETAPRVCNLYHPTDETWRRASKAPAVKPDKKGILDWAERNKARRSKAK